MAKTDLRSAKVVEMLNQARTGNEVELWKFSGDHLKGKVFPSNKGNIGVDQGADHGGKKWVKETVVKRVILDGVDSDTPDEEDPQATAGEATGEEANAASGDEDDYEPEEGDSDE